MKFFNDADCEVRQAVFALTPELIVGMCKTGNEIHARVVNNGLPSDAKIIRTAYCQFSDTVKALLGSTEFFPVAPGAEIPELPTTAMENIGFATCD